MPHIASTNKKLQVMRAKLMTSINVELTRHSASGSRLKTKSWGIHKDYPMARQCASELKDRCGQFCSIFIKILTLSMIWFLSVSFFYAWGILVKVILNQLLSTIAVGTTSIIYFIYSYFDLFSEVKALLKGIVKILNVFLNIDNWSFPRGNS